MPIKKTDLYSSLWKTCDELRGSMDASQYKDYVLVLLFMKYVTDKYLWDDNALIVIPEWWSFKDMVALKNQADIWDKMNKIIAKLAEENELKWVIDTTDFNDEEKLGKWKDMVDRLTKLIAIFENPWLDFSKNKAEWDDILWDAYEYLMRHFATESWKSKWQFYTPSEVSRVMAKIIWIWNSTSQSQTVYDPTCWSGSLLLKASNESPRWLTIYWQENDLATSALAKMNMVIHNNEWAMIHKWNTLSTPFFKDNIWNLKTFDFIVSNPPFSTKSWSSWFDPKNDESSRFDDWLPPDKNWDYAFLQHIIKSLKQTWKWAVILPHWVLFRWNAEWSIRRNIIKKWYIKAIIWLPANLFYGTWIPACIIILDKETAQNRKNIFMIDASKWFVKDWNKNKLREQDIHKIVDVFIKWIEINKYSRNVSIQEIQKNDYNLNIPRYIDTSNDEDLQSIEAHLKWWIPNIDIEKMSDYWEVYPNLRNELFWDLRDWYSKIKIQEEDIKNIILNHKEFLDYRTTINQVFDIWKKEAITNLKVLDKWLKPKKIISEVSESLLLSFTKLNLIDKYDMYQHFMDYSNEIMQDDLYILSSEWWRVETYRVLEKDKKWIEKDKWWTCDLVPKNLIIKAYFNIEKNKIEDLQNDLDNITRQIEELAEENSWEEWLLEEVKNDAWNISKATITKRLREIKGNNEYIEEIKLLNKYLVLLDNETEFKKQFKVLDTELDKLVYKKYPILTTEEIKILIVNNKWILAIEQSLEWELDRVSQSLTWRIKELSERYNSTLWELTNKVYDYEDKVKNHLVKMWFSI